MEYLLLDDKGETLQECTIVSEGYTGYLALESLKPDYSKGEMVVNKSLWEVYCQRQQMKRQKGL